MVKRALPLVVADSSCFIDFFTNHDDDRAQRVAEILQEHNKTIQIILPIVVYLETLGRGQMGKGGISGGDTTARQKAFDNMRDWIESQDYVIASLDDIVVIRAIDFMYDYGLRGMDASILALANVHGIKTVYTFDKDMIKARKNPRAESIRAASMH